MEYSLGMDPGFTGTGIWGINPSWQQGLGKVWEVGKIPLLLPSNFGLVGKNSQRNFWNCGGAQKDFPWILFAVMKPGFIF